MNEWFELRQRLKCKETIDKVAYEQFKKEKDYWKQVIIRIVALVKFLAKYGLAFRGTNEKLYQKGNGYFFGLVEKLEEFDPIMKEHVRRVLNEECHVHFLGQNIQNVIELLGDKVRTEIIKKVKQAKYYSIILNCTPDTSHQEQMSIIVRYVNFNSSSMTVEESFLGFLVVDDTTGLGLFEVTCKELESLGLDIGDMRGQGYDNGVNVVSKRLQSKDVVLDVAIDEVGKLIKFLKNYREVGFSKALDEAGEIANEIGVNAEFRKKRLKTLNEAKLKECCYRLQDALKYEGESDIDAKELYTELNLTNTFLPRHVDNSFDVLDYIFQRSTTYPNVINAYKVLLTIPVTVASAERSFSKLKLLKAYLHSKMSQERLNGLATISIKSEILDTMDYKELIESFASKNARRTTLFA
ncbi:uncharacterized protein LOC110944624 [Helianthus annuus]|uniref:uncharacterized protein LOC110944624 n=1 Tax=Helianthus annuus TaxID=4232 RepID=UPI000B8FA983|nr:uncharacterized protein LOC110944624 [Helianthus annuus]